jgi:hypothetical protein
MTTTARVDKLLRRHATATSHCSDEHNLFSREAGHPTEHHARRSYYGDGAASRGASTPGLDLSEMFRVV